MVTIVKDTNEGPKKKKLIHHLFHIGQRLTDGIVVSFTILVVRSLSRGCEPEEGISASNRISDDIVFHITPVNYLSVTDI